MERDKLVRRLMETFLGELEGHVHALNRALLALEKDPPAEAAAELLTLLFRTAHSLKGASRSVSVSLIETACHQLEGILSAAKEGLVARDAEFFQLLFATADAIEDAGKRLRQKHELSGAPLATLLPRLEAASREPAAPRARPRRSAQAAVSAPPLGPLGRQGVVHVQPEKLDALLARSGELLVTRRRVGARVEEIDALHQFVQRWHAEWNKAEKPLRDVLRDGDRGNRRILSAVAPGVAPAHRLPRRVARSIGQTTDNLRRLDEELDRLAGGLAADLDDLERAAIPLEEEVRRVRMLPFAEACEGLDRNVRDLAKAADKEVDLTIEGGDIELDRSILEGLKDPLLHLVRNAVDHGVETAAERRALGKPARARVTVAAALHGTQVEIAVVDDGRGLDLEAIRDQARKKGCPEPRDHRDLAHLIFLPGFSTSRFITELSGRGVGLDVVKSRVELLHGSVDFSFERGRGTRFVIAVPLTLTTIQVLLVAAGGGIFALPQASLHRLLRAGLGDIRSVEGREVLSVDGAPVPVVSLAETLGLPAPEIVRVGGKVPIVVLAAGDEQMAFAVDGLLAAQEVVVKSLGPRLGRVRNIAGVTVLPTGRVAFILNAADLIRTGLGRAPSQALSAALKERAPEVKKRVLVVDDSVTTRSLEKSILEAAGYDVMVAVDGVEAWRILQERGADLVVADVDMPRMDGFALTEVIRGSKRLRDLPVVLVTALESERDKSRGIEVGADAYLLKSAFDQRNLLETIVQLL